MMESKIDTASPHILAQNRERWNETSRPDHLVLKPHSLPVLCHSKKLTAGESKSIQGELLQSMHRQCLCKYRHTATYADALKSHRSEAESGVGKTSRSLEGITARNSQQANQNWWKRPERL